MTDKSKQIANYNDAFRKDILNPNPYDLKIPGIYSFSEGLSNLPMPEQRAIMVKVHDFDDFNGENDPHGEHDFGRFQFGENSQDIIWKIDYYNENYKYGSEDPANLSKTRRVLTTMLACEY